MKRLSKFAALSLVQWKHQRNELIVFTLLGAALAPLANWGSLLSQTRSGRMMTGPLLEGRAAIPVILPAIAALVGLLLAMRPFDLDERARHSYPLALPITRAQYARFRIGSALAAALLPTLGILVGALVAANGLAIQSELRAFPVGLALRFYLAVVVAFSIAFALRYGLGRQLMRVLVAVGLTVAVVEMVAAFLFNSSLLVPALDFLLTAPFSPLRVFFADWKLFDA